MATQHLQVKLISAMAGSASQTTSYGNDMVLEFRSAPVYGEWNGIPYSQNFCHASWDIQSRAAISEGASDSYSNGTVGNDHNHP